MSQHLPKALRHLDVEIPRVLPVSTAFEWGMSRDAVAHAIATRGWRRLTRGILLTVPGPATRGDWINVGLELAGPTGALSGWDAVRIAGLGEPTPPRREVLVVTRSGRNRVIGGVRIRPTSRPFSSWTLPFEHPELPLVTIVNVARAVADTALQYDRLAPVRALVTSAVQSGRCRVEDLIAEAQRAPRNHSAFLHASMADLRSGARSITEAEAIEILRRAPVPVFEANVPIVTVSGIVLGVADLLWRELRAILEIQSRQFHFAEADWRNTMRRHNRLTPYGLALQHYPPAEIRGRAAAWAKEVERWLRARAAELGVPYIVPARRPQADLYPQPLVVPDLIAA
jgi:hypothetical protein